VLSIGRVWERRDVEKWARETLWRPMANTDALPQLLTIDQLAERLGVSIRHIRRLIAERRVPYLKVGWFIRFDPAEIATWLAVLGIRNTSTTGDRSDLTFSSSRSASRIRRECVPSLGSSDRLLALRRPSVCH
jgi:excisionase family DNA binding protein